MEQGSPLIASLKRRLQQPEVLVALFLGLAAGLLINTDWNKKDGDAASPGEGPGLQVNQLPSEVIHPGDNAQEVLARSPSPAVFLFASGTHHMMSVTPRDGDVFLGEPGAIVSGARTVEAFGREGKLWFAEGQSQQGHAAGECEPGYAACRFPEDAFFDDVLLKRVASKGEVVPGTWFLDYASDRAYFADDPSGRRVEISVLPHAFSSSAEDVTITGLTIEKYASPAQRGAVESRTGTSEVRPGSGWRVESNEIRWNHAAGVHVGPNSTVTGNVIHHNGQIGIKGGDENSLISNNTITYNNTVGFMMHWEAGGAKFTHTTNLVVRDNVVAHNRGHGLWTDIDNINTLYEGNQVRDNVLIGIFHEISYDATIRGNILSGNGRGDDAWLWGGQIVVANSSKVEIVENQVIVPADAGDGITLIQQNRGSGEYGPRVTLNNYVHHNVLTYLGLQGSTGAAADYDEHRLLEGNNRFDANRYYGVEPDLPLWQWQGSVDWWALQKQGQERNGSHSAGVPASP